MEEDVIDDEMTFDPQDLLGDPARQEISQTSLEIMQLLAECEGGHEVFGNIHQGNFIYDNASLVGSSSELSDIFQDDGQSEVHSTHRLDDILVKSIDSLNKSPKKKISHPPNHIQEKKKPRKSKEKLEKKSQKPNCNSSMKKKGSACGSGEQCQYKRQVKSGTSDGNETTTQQSSDVISNPTDSSSSQRYAKSSKYKLGDDGKYTCDICGRKFDALKPLLIHSTKHRQKVRLVRKSRSKEGQNGRGITSAIIATPGKRKSLSIEEQKGGNSTPAINTNYIQHSKSTVRSTGYQCESSIIKRTPDKCRKSAFEMTHDQSMTSAIKSPPGRCSTSKIKTTPGQVRRAELVQRGPLFLDGTNSVTEVNRTSPEGGRHRRLDVSSKTPSFHDSCWKTNTKSCRRKLECGDCCKTRAENSVCSNVLESLSRHGTHEYLTWSASKSKTSCRTQNSSVKSCDDDSELVRSPSKSKTSCRTQNSSVTSCDNGSELVQISSKSKASCRTQNSSVKLGDKEIVRNSSESKTNCGTDNGRELVLNSTAEETSDESRTQKKSVIPAVLNSECNYTRKRKASDRFSGESYPMKRVCLLDRFTDDTTEDDTDSNLSCDTVHLSTVDTNPVTNGGLVQHFDDNHSMENSTRKVRKKVQIRPGGDNSKLIGGLVQHFDDDHSTESSTKNGRKKVKIRRGHLVRKRTPAVCKDPQASDTLSVCTLDTVGGGNAPHGNDGVVEDYSRATQSLTEDRDRSKIIQSQIPATLSHIDKYCANSKSVVPVSDEVEQAVTERTCLSNHGECKVQHTGRALDHRVNKLLSGEHLTLDTDDCGECYDCDEEGVRDCDVESVRDFSSDDESEPLVLLKQSCRTLPLRALLNLARHQKLERDSSQTIQDNVTNNFFESQSLSLSKKCCQYSVEQEEEQAIYDDENDLLGKIENISQKISDLSNPILTDWMSSDVRDTVTTPKSVNMCSTNVPCDNSFEIISVSECLSVDDEKSISTSEPTKVSAESQKSVSTSEQTKVPSESQNIASASEPTEVSSESEKSVSTSEPTKVSSEFQKSASTSEPTTISVESKKLPKPSRSFDKPQSTQEDSPSSDLGNRHVVELGTFYENHHGNYKTQTSDLNQGDLMTKVVQSGTSVGRCVGMEGSDGLQKSKMDEVCDVQECPKLFSDCTLFVVKSIADDNCVQISKSVLRRSSAGSDSDVENTSTEAVTQKSPETDTVDGKFNQRHRNTEESNDFVADSVTECLDDSSVSDKHLDNQTVDIRDDSMISSRDPVKEITRYISRESELGWKPYRIGIQQTLPKNIMSTCSMVETFADDMVTGMINVIDTETNSSDSSSVFSSFHDYCARQISYQNFLQWKLNENQSTEKSYDHNNTCARIVSYQTFRKTKYQNLSLTEKYLEEILQLCDTETLQTDEGSRNTLMMLVDQSHYRLKQADVRKLNIEEIKNLRQLMVMGLDAAISKKQPGVIDLDTNSAGVDASSDEVDKLGAYSNIVNRFGANNDGIDKFAANNDEIDKFGANIDEFGSNTDIRQDTICVESDSVPYKNARDCAVSCDQTNLKISPIDNETFLDSQDNRSRSFTPSVLTTGLDHDICITPGTKSCQLTSPQSKNITSGTESCNDTSQQSKNITSRTGSCYSTSPRSKDQQTDLSDFNQVITDIRKDRVSLCSEAFSSDSSESSEDECDVPANMNQDDICARVLPFETNIMHKFSYKTKQLLREYNNRQQTVVGGSLSVTEDSCSNRGLKVTDDHTQTLSSLDENECYVYEMYKLGSVSSISTNSNSTQNQKDYKQNTGDHQIQSGLREIDTDGRSSSERRELKSPKQAVKLGDNQGSNCDELTLKGDLIKFKSCMEDISSSFLNQQNILSVEEQRYLKSPKKLWFRNYMGRKLTTEEKIGDNSQTTNSLTHQKIFVFPEGHSNVEEELVSYSDPDQVTRGKENTLEINTVDETTECSEVFKAHMCETISGINEESQTSDVNKQQIDEESRTLNLNRQQIYEYTQSCNLNRQQIAEESRTSNLNRQQIDEESRGFNMNRRQSDDEYTSDTHSRYGVCSRTSLFKTRQSCARACRDGYMRGCARSREFMRKSCDEN